MRILIFNWRDIKNPEAGGAEVHLDEVFSRIAAMGHEVTLFCSRFPGSPSRENVNGIDVVREGGRFLFNYRVAWKYLTHFRGQRFDIVIDDWNKIPFFTPWYVREPLLGITHHLFGKSIFIEVSFPVAAYVYLAELLALRAYRNTPFIVGSPSTHEELVCNGFQPSNIRVINYGIEQSLYTQVGVPKSDTPLVGHVGRLKRYKSVEHLLQAFKPVRERLTNAKLMILGDGDDSPRLKKIAGDLGLGDSVHFAGYVSDADKIQYLNQMHVVVNTSAKEGWGLTVVETNACGTCVIASDVPGLRDSVANGESGLLYEYGNIQQLTKAILGVLRDEDFRDRLSRGALKWAARFDWDTAAKQTLEVLQKVTTMRKV